MTTATLVGLCALGAAACGDDDAGSSSETGTPSGASGGDGSAGGASVVATTTVWADVVDAATCRGDAGIEVTSLLPPGADPHHYEPSLHDRETLDEADVVVSNGLDLGEGLLGLLDTVPTDRHVQVAELTGVATRPFDADEDHADHDESHDDESHDDESHDGGEHDHDGHDHDGADPHVWLAPQLVADAVAPLAERIVEATGVDPARVERCARDYAAELRRLDHDIAEQVETIPADRRVLVTNHHAYGYFADRYGFDIVGTVIPSTSTMAETNPADLEALADTIESEGVPAIFVDAQNDDAVAQALAERIGGVEVVALDTEGVGDGSDDDTYVAMMESNAALIVDALAGEGTAER